MTLAGHERFAVYAAPARGSALARLGAAWLGRDAESGEELPRPEAPADLPALTVSPRRYGFHGTLKPPFRLASGCSAADLDAAVAALAARLAPVEAPPLAVTRMGGFLALCPSGPALHDPDAAPATRLAGLAFETVTALDAFRAPPTADELARRRAAGLSPRQEAMLERYGYPYVGPEFRFHLTLTDRLPGDRREELARAAGAWFQPALQAPFRVAELCLFGDPGGGRPFRLLRRHALTG